MNKLFPHIWANDLEYSDAGGVTKPPYAPSVTFSVTDHPPRIDFACNPNTILLTWLDERSCSDHEHSQKTWTLFNMRVLRLLVIYAHLVLKIKKKKILINDLLIYGYVLDTVFLF